MRVIRRTGAALIGLLLAALSGAVAGAEEGHGELLRQAREQLDHQDYREVLETLEPLLEGPRRPVRVRLQALEVAAVARLLLRQQDEAQALFEALLALDPAHELGDPSYSPRISGFFAMVRESLGRSAPPEVQLRLEAPPRARAGLPVEVAVRLAGGRERVDRVVLLVRGGADEDFREVPMACSAEDRCRARLEAPEPGESLELYAEARAPSGLGLGSAGSPTTPVRLVVEAGAPDRGPEPAVRARAWHRTWWFWTAVGLGAAAVVSGVTAGALLYEPPEPGPGTMGTARLP